MTAHITKTWFEDGKLITQGFEEKDTYKREWVGLTDDEIDECDWGQSERDHARAIEAKLKDKNCAG
jgi:hypothetical protein